MATTVNAMERTRERIPRAVDAGVTQFVVPTSPPVFDAVSNRQGFGATSDTQSHTCTGSDLVLYAVVYLHEQSGTRDHPTGVTYNAVAMTSVASTAVTNENFSLWRLINPATGANDCVASYTEAKNQSYLGCFSYTNVDQTTPEDTSITATSYASNTATNISQNVTTATDDAFVVALFNNANGAINPTPGGSETSRKEFNFSSIDFIWQDLLKETAGLQATSIDMDSGSRDKQMMSFAIRPVT